MDEKNSEICNKLVGLLHPFLRFFDAKDRRNNMSKSKEVDTRAQVLETIHALLPMMSNPMQQYKAFSKLLGPFGLQMITYPPARKMLGEIFLQLGKIQQGTCIYIYK